MQREFGHTAHLRAIVYPAGILAERRFLMEGVRLEDI